MWKIHRYYLREVAVNALLTFVVLFGIALISLLYKGLRVAKGGDLVDAALTTVLLVADIFPHLLTFALMFGTVLTFARASQEREITAIRALGISPRVPMVSSMIIGLVCSLIATWALHYEIPWAHYHKYRVVANLVAGRMQAYFKDEDRIDLEGGAVMTWQEKVPIGDLEDGRFEYREVNIFLGSDQSLLKRISPTGSRSAPLIMADRVWFEDDPQARSITAYLEGLTLPFAEGWIRMKAVDFGMNLESIVKRDSRHANHKDLGSDLLLAEVYRGAYPDPNAAYYTVHRRACFALMPFLLAPLGFCIGVMSRERGRVLAMSFCMVPLAVVYLCDFLGESSMRHLQFPPIGWLPAVVVLLAGTPFCWRLLRV